jgi:hypothetical protein
MRFELDQYNRNVSDEELIADVQRVASELGKQSVTRAEQDARGRFHSTTLLRRFGSWFGAIEKAGLEKSRTPMNLPEEELFRNLEEIWINLGRQPRYQEIVKPASRYSVATYENRFGGWRNALEAFVTYINEEENFTSESLIESQKLEPKVQQQGSRNINWRLRFIVMRRDNFKCKACGKSPATDPTITLDVDHIKAWSKGGLTVLENLQTLCTKCNIGKSNLEFMATNEAQNG